MRYHTISVTAVAIGVALAVGCETPSGRPDNTATGALVGAGVGAAGRVDHDIDDPLADAGVLEIDDLRSAQMIHRVRITNLADDDFVADAPHAEGFDMHAVWPVR